MSGAPDMDADDADGFVLLHAGDLAAWAEIGRMEEASVRPNVRGSLSALDFKIETNEQKQTKGIVMAKKIFSLPIGSIGSAELVVEAGKLRLNGAYGSKDSSDFDAVVSVGEPLAKILDPVKSAFIDKLKGLIPGDLDDKIIDAAWAKALAALSEEV